MENYKSESKVKTYKRLRDDSETNSESKRVRYEDEVNSYDSKVPETKISADVSKIRDEMLNILDEPEDCTEIQDLESVIKSFEEEIVHSTPAPDPGELGYLLEASDDELGLPPANSPINDKPKEELHDLADNPSYAFAFDENVEFENAITSYDSFGFEFGFGEGIGGNNDGDFVTVGRLFDYSEASDSAEFSWQPESLPAR